MAREIDFPPVWLAGFAAVGGLAGRIWPVDTAVNEPVGAAVVAAGLALILVAAGQMVLARTTVIPRRDPDALVATGVFRLSRNPIYLGDALLLAGLYVSWGALIALPLVAVFMFLIDRRFIRDEEQRLERRFGEVYADYRSRTRRWL